MEIYIVGGYVRDSILGRKTSDTDFVVVGSSPEEMLSLGFKCVGKDFPVYLHPITGDEYALARQERNTGASHGDFSFNVDNVSLEDDLARRDLTINSIAIPVNVNIETGEFKVIGSYIDPFNGIDDLISKTLKHTTPAFQEDPLRVLRVARFLSQLGDGWTVSFDTLKLMDKIHRSGGLDFLTKERVWMEMEKAMKGEQPSKFFRIMNRYGLLGEQFKSMSWIVEREDHHPERSLFEHIMLVVDRAKELGGCPEVIFASLMHDLGKPFCYKNYHKAHGHEDNGVDMIHTWCLANKIPNSYRELAKVVCKHHTNIHRITTSTRMKPSKVVRLLKDLRIGRDDTFLEKVLIACQADAQGRGGYFPQKPYSQRETMLTLADHYRKLDTKAISKKALEDGKSGVAIGNMINQARVAHIKEFIKEYDNGRL